MAEVEVAEDLASDTFLTAAQTWGIKGIPPNPVAWLYQVAANKAKNHLQRKAVFDSKVAPDIQQAGVVTAPVEEIDLSPRHINDSQLHLLFAVCHPAIPPEAQIGLALRILCGFGIEEIADAFLTNKETIHKRLFRAKEKLRAVQIDITLPAPAELEARLSVVLKTIYLLFNEGYYSMSQHPTLRKELCFEAMRLCTLLVENELTNQPAVNALLALMCFHASRFDARTNAAGELILYADQDTQLWNTDLICKGGYFLRCAASGNALSPYHLDAGIAYWHTQRADSPEKWDQVLQLYNHLLQIAWSPAAALNRTYAFSKVHGKEAALREAEKLALTHHPFYPLLLGELYTGLNTTLARRYLEEALHLARHGAEKQVIQQKIARL